MRKIKGRTPKKIAAAKKEMAKALLRLSFA